MTGLTQIQFGDTVIGLKFGMEANRMYLEHIGLAYARIEQKHYNERDIAALLFAGYHNYCSVNDLIADKTQGWFINNVEDNLEEMAQEFERVARVYEQSKHTRRTLKHIEDVTEDLKKKMTNLTGQPSKPSVTENLASKGTESSPT